MKVKVIGAGLAGSEAAWQLANRGIEVALYEIKPKKMTPAHHSEDFAELVCSNSLRGDRLENAVGLLKEELRRCGSLILACADATRVEAGGCLAVDRGGFSRMVTEKIRNHPNIAVISEEITEVPEGPVIVATGPLTSDALSEAIGHHTVADKFRVFQTGYHGEYPLLLAEFQVGLEAHQIVHAFCRVVLPQLHHGVRLMAGGRISQPHGLHGAVAQGIHT